MKIGKLLTAVVCSAVILTGCKDIDTSIETYTEIQQIQQDGTTVESAVLPYVMENIPEKEALCYDAFVNGVRAFQNEITLPETLTPEEMRNLYITAYTEETDIYWLSGVYAPIPMDSDRITVKYRYTQEESAEMQQKINLAVADVMKKVSPDATPYEKMAIFHDEIIKNCDFEKDTYYGITVYGALVEGTAQCEGYANAFSYLCDIAGIENITVRGANAKGDSHVWNKVRIDGEWYNVDLTWDDPYMKRDADNFVRHDYFFVSDPEIENITHFPDESLFAHPNCTDASENYYIRNGLTVNTSEEATEMMKKLVAKAAVKKSTEVEIRFTDESEYILAATSLFDNKEIKTIYESVNAEKGTEISNAYTYRNDDLWILHVSLIYA